MTFPMHMPMGRAPARTDNRTLRLATYLDGNMALNIPDSVDWGAKQPRNPLYANDRISDCVVAGAAKLVNNHRADLGFTDYLVPEVEVLHEYSALTGYDPTTGANDRGVVMLDALTRWRQQGLFGWRMPFFLAVNHSHEEEVRAAHYYGGGLLAGLNLPLTARDQLQAGRAWAYTQLPWGRAAPASWGRHCVLIDAVRPDGYRCRTWDQQQVMSQVWFQVYCEELYVIPSADWFGEGDKCPLGLDGPTLLADLRRACA